MILIYLFLFFDMVFIILDFYFYYNLKICILKYIVYNHIFLYNGLMVWAANVQIRGIFEINFLKINYLQ